MPKRKKPARVDTLFYEYLREKKKNEKWIDVTFYPVWEINRLLDLNFDLEPRIERRENRVFLVYKDPEYLLKIKR